MMNRTWLARGILVCYLGGVMLTLYFGWANEYYQWDGSALSLLMAYTAFAVVGSLIISRHPRHALGWLFMASSFLFIGGYLAERYVWYALATQPNHLPGIVFMAWLGTWYWYPMVILTIIFTPLLFPDGRLPSPRWRPWVVMPTLLLIVMTVYGAVQPWLGYGGPIHNPIGIAAAGGLEESFLGSIVGALFVLSFVMAISSVFWRFRRARGVERQQLKWFAYASGLVTGLALLPLLGGIQVPDLLDGIALALVPIAIGIAILRYRLYDIDIIIRRTLLYTLLTAVLTAIYFSSVVLLQSLFRTLSGQTNTIAIIISTLTIAALFNPLRHRIQDFIDCRFYRRKYDAQKTLAAFATTVRNEVELDKLTGELVRVIDETMQPAHISLWLRNDTPLPSPDRDMASRESNAEWRMRSAEWNG